MVYRFVHLSDIHFGQEREGTLVVHEDVRSALLLDASALAARRGKADLVIVGGDTAFRGEPDEYKRAGEWLDKLTEAVKCDAETDVRVVPGNHDCDLSQISRLALTFHRSIREGALKSAYGDLEDLGKRAEEANPLLPKLKAYRDFASGYDSDFRSLTCPLWTRDFEIAEGIVFRLVGMNSVQISEGKDRVGDLILGCTQYVLPEEPYLVYAVVLHHPLDWFMDKVEAKQYLHNRARLIMVGHEHIPSISKTVDILNQERLDIYSGATNPPESGALYRCTYNWIEVSLREKAGSHVLAVNIFPRVWAPEQTRFTPDTPPRTGHEAAEFEIACPALRPTERDAPRTTHREAPIAAASSPAAKPQHDMGPSPGRTTTRDIEAAVARLKFLFWRYLDWRQRLKVLVAADALPASADRPVPQTMERLALQTAREQGKLAAIWDAMMDHVPSSKRQENPFNEA